MRVIEVGAAIVLSAATATPLAAQEALPLGDDAMLRRYESHWNQLYQELRVSSGRCDILTARLDAWFDQRQEELDTLYARSTGIYGRLTDEQLERMDDVQEPMVLILADVSARCLSERGFDEALRRVQMLLTFGEG